MNLIANSKNEQVVFFIIILAFNVCFLLCIGQACDAVKKTRAWDCKTSGWPACEVPPGLGYDADDISIIMKCVCLFVRHEKWQLSRSAPIRRGLTISRGLRCLLGIANICQFWGNTAPPIRGHQKVHKFMPKWADEGQSLAAYIPKRASACKKCSTAGGGGGD